MKRGVFLVASLVGCVACAPIPAPVAPPDAWPTAVGAPSSPRSPAPPAPTAPPPPAPLSLAGLDFRPLDATAVDVLADESAASYGINATASAYRANRTPATVGYLPDGAGSGNYTFQILPGRYPSAEAGCAPAPSLMLAARTPAFRGDFTTVVTRDLRPIVNAWAPDAAFANERPSYAPKFRLLAFADEDLRPVALHVWPVRFVSAAQRETLTFYRTPVRRGQDTPAEPAVALALLTRWGPCGAPDEAAVPVGRAEAVRRLAAAMVDPAAVSAEERAGRDYFLGTPYEQAPVLREAPPPGRNGVPDFTAACVDGGAKVELRDWFGRRVWFVSAYASWVVGRPPACEPQDHPAFGRYVSAAGPHGMVDAETGAVIRFQRAHRLDRLPLWPEGPMASAPPP